MEIKRTCNAGVLLRLDNVSILIDGVCKELFPYKGTPESILNELILNPPDILAFTHKHEDHYDSSYAENYKGTILRPENGSENLLHNKGDIKIEGISTRHIGKTDVPHMSFIITGSKTVWFMGDASPLSLKRFKEYPKPDLIIAPYAYANTFSSWKMTKETGAEKIVILHLPDRENDTLSIRQEVEKITAGDLSVHIPEIDEILILG